MKLLTLMAKRWRFGVAVVHALDALEAMTVEFPRMHAEALSHPRTPATESACLECEEMLNSARQALHNLGRKWVV